MINKLVAKITRIQSLDALHIVSFDFFGETLTMMSLDLSEEIIVGTQVLLSVKSTSVALAKNVEGELSYSNQLQSKILSIDKGELLSSIVLGIGDARIESIITLASQERMKLKVGDEVTSLIKANEISIGEVIR